MLFSEIVNMFLENIVMDALKKGLKKGLKKQDYGATGKFAQKLLHG